ncbi:hypothetical protein VNO77_19193 [Canavalia gladiata]|uniref:Uncharacterized protein n=1 Tax=Canavalia gladiata TaxID=3824 RepID=A0AAN9LMX5_CANGL
MHPGPPLEQSDQYRFKYMHASWSRGTQGHLTPAASVIWRSIYGCNTYHQPFSRERCVRNFQAWPIDKPLVLKLAQSIHGRRASSNQDIHIKAQNKHLRHRLMESYSLSPLIHKQFSFGVESMIIQ